MTLKQWKEEIINSTCYSYFYRTDPPPELFWYSRRICVRKFHFKDLIHEYFLLNIETLKNIDKYAGEILFISLSDRCEQRENDDMISRQSYLANM